MPKMGLFGRLKKERNIMDYNFEKETKKHQKELIDTINEIADSWCHIFLNEKDYEPPWRALDLILFPQLDILDNTEISKTLVNDTGKFPTYNYLKSKSRKELLKLANYLKGE